MQDDSRASAGLFCTASTQSNISSASGLEGLDWGQLRVDGVTVASITAAQFVLANCLAVSRRSAGSRIFVSWNQMAAWLRQTAGLRAAA